MFPDGRHTSCDASWHSWIVSESNGTRINSKGATPNHLKRKAGIGGREQTPLMGAIHSATSWVIIGQEGCRTSSSIRFFAGRIRYDRPNCLSPMRMRLCALGRIRNLGRVDASTLFVRASACIVSMNAPAVGSMLPHPGEMISVSEPDLTSPHRRGRARYVLIELKSRRVATSNREETGS